MLKKKNRLPGKGFRAEKTYSLPGLSLKISKSSQSDARFGFVVSKKIDPRATSRNKIKRAFRKFVRENLKEIKSGVDFLFIVKNAPSDETFIELERLLKKEKLL